MDVVGWWKDVCEDVCITATVLPGGSEAIRRRFVLDEALRLPGRWVCFTDPIHFDFVMGVPGGIGGPCIYCT